MVEKDVGRDSLVIFRGVRQTARVADHHGETRQAIKVKI